MGRTCLGVAGSQASKRYWTGVVDEMVRTKIGAMLHRYKRAMKYAAFVQIREPPSRKSQALDFCARWKRVVSRRVFFPAAAQLCARGELASMADFSQEAVAEIWFQEKRVITVAEHGAWWGESTFQSDKSPGAGALERASARLKIPSRAGFGCVAGVSPRRGERETQTGTQGKNSPGK